MNDVFISSVQFHFFFIALREHLSSSHKVNRIRRRGGKKHEEEENVQFIHANGAI